MALTNPDNTPNRRLDWIRFNVPLNDALAPLDPASTAGATLWAGYVTGWTTWNHVRTAAALAAGAFLTIALRLARE